MHHPSRPLDVVPPQCRCSSAPPSFSPIECRRRHHFAAYRNSYQDLTASMSVSDCYRYPRGHRLHSPVSFSNPWISIRRFNCSGRQLRSRDPFRCSTLRPALKHTALITLAINRIGPLCPLSRTRSRCVGNSGPVQGHAWQKESSRGIGVASFGPWDSHWTSVQD